MKESRSYYENFEEGLQRLRELYFQKQNLPSEISHIKNFENMSQQRQQQKFIDNEIFQSLNRLENLFRQKENNNVQNTKLYISEAPLQQLDLLKKKYQTTQNELSQTIKNLNLNKNDENTLHVENLKILQQNLQNPDNFQDQHILNQTQLMAHQLQKYLQKVNQLLSEINTKTKSIYKYNQIQFQFTKDLFKKTHNFHQSRTKNNVSQSVDYIDQKYQKKIIQMKQMVKKIYKKYQISQQKVLQCKKNQKLNMQKFFDFAQKYDMLVQSFDLKFQKIKQKLQIKRRTSYLTQIKESKIINQFGSQVENHNKNLRSNLFQQQNPTQQDQFQFYKSPSISLNNSIQQRETKSAMKDQQLRPSLFLPNERFNQIDLEYHKKQSQYKDAEIHNLKMMLQKQKILEKSLKTQIKNLQGQLKQKSQKSTKQVSIESQEYVSLQEDSTKLELIENLKYLEQIEIELRQRCENLSQQIENNQLTVFQYSKENYKLKQTIKNLEEMNKELQLQKSPKSLQQSSVKVESKKIDLSKIQYKIDKIFTKKDIQNSLNKLLIKQENLQGKVQLLKQFARQLKQQNINVQRQLNLQNVSLQNEKNKSQSLRQQLTVLSQKKISSIPESLKYINENGNKIQQLQEINNNQYQKLKLQEEKIILNLTNIQELQEKERQLIQKNKQLQLELDNLKLIEQNLNEDKSHQKTDLLQQELNEYKFKLQQLQQQLQDKNQETKILQSQISIQKQPLSNKNIQTSLVLEVQTQKNNLQKFFIEKNINRLGQIKTQMNLMMNFQLKDQQVKMKIEKLGNILYNLNQNLKYYIQAYKDKSDQIYEIEQKESQSKQTIFEREKTIQDLQYQLQTQKAKESQEREQKKAQKSGKELEKRNEIFNIKKIIERIEHAMKIKDNSISKLKNKLQNVKEKLLKAKLSHQNYKSIQEIEFQNFQSKQKLENLKKQKDKQKKKIDLQKTIQEKDDTINKLNLEHNKTYQSLDSKYTQVKNQLQSVQEQKEKLENVFDVLNSKKKNKEMINRLSDYYDEIQRLKLENQKLKSENEDNQQKLSMEKVNKKHFVQKMAEQQTNIDNLKSELENVNKENQALKQQSLKLLSLTDQLENQLGIKIQSKNIQKVQKKLQDLMEEQQLSRDFIKEVKIILQINKDQKEIYQIILKSLTNQGDKKHSLMYTSQIPIQQQEDELQFQFQNKEISLKLKDLQKIIDELQQEKDKYKEIIEQLEFDKKVLKNDLTNLSNQVQSGQQKMNGINEKFENIQEMKNRVTFLIIKILQGLSKKISDQQSLQELYDLLQSPNDKKTAIDFMINQLIE